ncbi:MAG: FecR domain-containing protein [Spirochaetaceae bacterium]|nr:FecR domain-containing protein [Spirochaetaceae bacterium]
MKKLICLFLFSFLIGTFSFASNEVAIVNSVVGKVEIQLNDNWVQVKNGDILTPGTVISTGFRSSAVLYIGKSLIEVRALTRLTIEEIVEQNQNYNTTMFLDAGNIKADIKKSDNKRVGFKVRTSVATASVRGTSGEIYSDGTLVCFSGKWAITPPEPRGTKTVITKEANSTEQIENTDEVAQTEQNEQVTQIENADQDFYDAVDDGAFIVTENQTITIGSNGKIIPPHEIAHTQAVSTGGLQSNDILETNSDLRITSPIQDSNSTNNEGRHTASIDITISIK